MPPRFRFRADDGSVAFQCPLQCARCEGRTRLDARCTRNTCIGTGLCWQHLLSTRNLRIKASAYGKGLFAMLDRRTDDEALQRIVFRKGDPIIDYGGEALLMAEIFSRYAQFTAPYALQTTSSRAEDGACLRGIGTLVNHGVDRVANARFSISSASNNAARIVAIKIIRHGQEIVINYGGAYRFGELTTHSTRR